MAFLRLVVLASLMSGSALAQVVDDSAARPGVSTPLASLQIEGAHRPGEVGLDRPSLEIDQVALGWVTADFYPPASRKSREEGVTTVGACLDERGKAVKTVVVQSSGFPRLDEAALKLMAALPMKPATMNGKAVAFCGYALPVDWKLPALPPGESKPAVKP